MDRRFHQQIIGLFNGRNPQANLIDRKTRFGRFILDCTRRELRCDGRTIPLTGRAFDLLAILVASPEKAFSRDELLDLLWADEAVEDGNLTQNIYLLRRALDPDGHGRSFIKTIPRFGYRFVHPTEAARHEAPRRQPRPLAAIAAAVLVALALASSAGLAPLNVPERAAEAEALGEYHLNLRGPGDLRTALQYFKEAKDSAPGDASAYAGAAAALALLAEYDRDGSGTRRSDLANASAFLHDAFVHNPHSSRALAVAGFIAYRFKDDYDDARALLRQAIAQDPSNAAAHHWYGVNLLASGDLAGATHEFETAHALQPTSEVFSRWLARAYVFGGRPDEAIATVSQALRIVPEDAAANLILASAEESRGHFNSALRVMQFLGANEPYERPYVIPDEARVRRILHERSSLPRKNGLDPFETAVFYVSIGEQQRAAAILRATHPSRIERALERFDPRLKQFRLNDDLRQYLAVTS